MVDPADAWTLTAICEDLDLIRRLQAAPPPACGGGLTPGLAGRVPGVADPIGQIVAQLDRGGPAAGRLIAAWIWQAAHQQPPKAKIHLAVRCGGKRADLTLEGESEAVTAELIQAAMDRAGLGG